MRGVMPSRGEVAPLDGRIWFATVGTGDATHFNLSITQANNNTPITGQTETSCYIHEGPLDNHCNLVFTPDAPLTPNTDYHIAPTPQISSKPAFRIDFPPKTALLRLIQPYPSSFQGYQARMSTTLTLAMGQQFQHNFRYNLHRVLPMTPSSRYMNKIIRAKTRTHHFCAHWRSRRNFVRWSLLEKKENTAMLYNMKILLETKATFNVLCYDPFAPEDTVVEEDTGRIPQYQDTAPPEDTSHHPKRNKNRL